MDTFWLKIAGAVVVVSVGGVLLFSLLSSKVQEAVDYEKMEQHVEAQEAKFQAELAEAERKALEAQAEKERTRQEMLEQAKAEAAKAKQQQNEKTQTQQTATQQPQPEPLILPPKPDEIDQTIQNAEAGRLYEWAVTEFKIARKPLMSFKRCVDFCREIIRRWPDSPEAAKARVLLRRVPARHRRQYKITDEEMGLTKE